MNVPDGDSRHGGYGHNCWDGCDVWEEKTPGELTLRKTDPPCGICGLADHYDGSLPLDAYRVALLRHVVWERNSVRPPTLESWPAYNAKKGNWE